MKSYGGSLLYAVGWLVWVWFIVMLTVYPPEKGAPWSELWQHVLGWCLVLLVFTVGFVVPVPAPFGSGLVPLPLPDVLVQGITDLILVLFPVVYFALFLNGRWGVWYCWVWYGLAVISHVLKKCLQQWSSQQLKKEAHQMHPELGVHLETELASAPPEPFASRFPFLGRGMLFLTMRGHYTVVKVPVEPNDGCLPANHIEMDIWSYNESTAPKPVLFFIHGGAWVAGNHRRHAVVGFINRMMRRGWVVVSCSYRKNRWPVHIMDCAAGLRWVHDNISEYGGDIDKGVVVCGASAGGQLAALLTAVARLEQNCPPELNGVKELVGDVKISGFLGWYPALDPKDDARVGAAWPACMGGETLMEWFFKLLVRPSRGWESVQPTWLLKSGNCKSFPPCLILHGTHDSVVPFKHSSFFFGELRNVRLHADDVLLPMNFIRHTYEICPSAVLDMSINVAAAWCNLVKSRA
eukprot:TRINITY_DN17146_c0_g1_i3.p1 TRINITY_DN17146_c0_g1~~TRINITY_DN17146_c0_g1_i3.p1  ORF type:complete len:473 (+),score=116.81 TRINITY_DN17146_c0_g1_i3:28-1419(+)